MKKTSLAPYLQVAPLAFIMVMFVALPLAVLLTLSFWQSDGISLTPAFSFENYEIVLGSPLTWTLLLATLKFAAITWVFTLLIGFTCSYFLVFHVKSLKLQIALFLLCTIPFWTSNVIRMISWVPFLGKEGLFNRFLQSVGLIDQPLEFLLFSDFAVILTYVHLFTLFMMVPIFNSMAKINPSVIEAAVDAGASPLMVLKDVIIPLTRTGIALGSIFVVTLVMGDFFVIRVMSGGQSANIASAMKNNIDQLYYPDAAAMAVFLIAAVLVPIVIILRIVDVRAELAR
ncbi:MAG: ABC transporter permease [Alphaproteobacteria bacterium]|nr:ABC transporter permease [Alphaproteobacteria bacterium]